MILHGRLGLIREMLPACGKLCDIGTDHARIPASALLDGLCRHAIATDIKSGPLERAARTVRHCGLEDRMELRLGAGLDPLAPGECDVLVIAGMGALMITEMLESGFEVARRASCIILQPMHAQERLRPWLRSHGYAILSERLACEGEKRYQVLAVRYDQAHAEGCPALAKEQPFTNEQPFTLVQPFAKEQPFTLVQPFAEYATSTHDRQQAELSRPPGWMPVTVKPLPGLPSDPSSPIYDRVGYSIVNLPDPLAVPWVNDWIKRQRRIAGGLQRSGRDPETLASAERLLQQLESCLLSLQADCDRMPPGDVLPARQDQTGVLHETDPSIPADRFRGMGDNAHVIGKQPEKAGCGEDAVLP